MNIDHDEPYAGYDDNREVHQRINRTLQQAGIPVQTDWAETDLIATKMNADLLATMSPLDNDPDAILLVESTIEDYHRHSERELIGDATGLYVLFAWDTSRIVAINQPEDWAALAGSMYPPTHECNVSADYECAEKQATELLPIKRRNIEIIYKCCTRCRDWFGLDAANRERRRHNLFNADSLSTPWPDRERVWKPEDTEPSW
ncbi:hypothetical protein ACQ86B_17430 [Mycolicibacterium aichiense]|uniref:hypothetical protein n=1 Tax=Mycolicibacterium aichiense TaxID=1799 RepID=UPI003D66DDE0